MVIGMFLKFSLTSLVLLFMFSISAEEVFYNSCDAEKTRFSLVKSGEKCSRGICEMYSFCKSNKGSLYVSHLCLSKNDGSCPSAIECLDDESIEIKKDEKIKTDSFENNQTGAGSISR